MSCHISCASPWKKKGALLAWVNDRWRGRIDLRLVCWLPEDADETSTAVFPQLADAPRILAGSKIRKLETIPLFLYFAGREENVGMVGWET
jgi:hypothetical protein